MYVSDHPNQNYINHPGRLCRQRIHRVTLTRAAAYSHCRRPVHNHPPSPSLFPTPTPATCPPLHPRLRNPMHHTPSGPPTEITGRPGYHCCHQHQVNIYMVWIIFFIYFFPPFAYFRKKSPLNMHHS